MSVALSHGDDRHEIGKPDVVVSLKDRDLVTYDLHPDGRILITYDEGTLGTVNSKVIVGWD